MLRISLVVYTGTVGVISLYDGDVGTIENELAACSGTVRVTMFETVSSRLVIIVFVPWNNVTKFVRVVYNVRVRTTDLSSLSISLLGITEIGGSDADGVGTIVRVMVKVSVMVWSCVSTSSIGVTKELVSENSVA